VCGASDPSRRRQPLNRPGHTEFPDALRGAQLGAGWGGAQRLTSLS